MTKSLDTRRSISEILAAMTDRQKARWFELNELDAAPNLRELVEQALDDGVSAEDVLATLVEAMTEEVQQGGDNDS